VTTSTTTRTSLRERRRALGISRLDLSIRAAVSTSWLAELENGQRPRGDALARVLRCLDELEAEREDAAA
jgi:predicted transcriptional regulator